MFFIASTLAINRITMHWPEGFEGQGDLMTHKFRTVLDSQQFCTRFFQPWWDDYFPKRVSPSILVRNIAHSSLLPSPIPYPIAPVQSWRSRLVHKTLEFGILPDGRKVDALECSFYCQDIRTDLEIWINFKVDGRQQVRVKGPIHIRCPDGWFADTYTTPDLRELETQEERTRNDFLMSLDPNAGAFVISPEGAHARRKGALVTHCNCQQALWVNRLKPPSELQATTSRVNTMTEISN